MNGKESTEAQVKIVTEVLMTWDELRESLDDIAKQIVEALNECTDGSTG